MLLYVNINIIIFELSNYIDICTNYKSETANKIVEKRWGGWGKIREKWGICLNCEVNCYYYAFFCVIIGVLRPVEFFMEEIKNVIVEQKHL